MDRLGFAGAAGTAPSPAVWNIDQHGWYDRQASSQAYTPRPQNVAVDGKGNLVITARAEQWTNTLGIVKPYTSARVDTKGKYAVAPGSYVEVALTLPDTVGCWPAFWFLGTDELTTGWPACGEIDMVEAYPGPSPHKVWRTLHQAGADGYDRPYGSTVAHCFSDFGELLGARARLFGVHADNNGIRFYVDRAVVQTISRAAVEQIGGTWPYGKPVDVVADIAVGGAGGTPTLSAYPARMVIGPVEVWPPGTNLSTLPAYGTATPTNR